MRKCFVRLLCSVLTVLILAAAPGTSLASDIEPGVNPLGDYTALGDSIAAGYGDTTGDGYVGRIYRLLTGDVRSFNIKLNNFGKNGSTSSDLLKSLQEDAAVRQALEKSRFVTISVGGNNLMGPVITAVSKAFNVNSKDNPDLAKDLEKALQNDPSLLVKLLQLLQPNALPAEMEKGAAQFQADWLKIIGCIGEIAPKATVYVSTVYNPMKPDNPFFSVFDKALSPINEVIKDTKGDYSVIDIYSMFLAYNGGKPLTGFNLLSGSVDPHPTPEGYECIYQSHLPYIKKNLSMGSKDLISRADTIMYLLQIFGLTAPVKSSFSDVKPEDYYYNAAGTAKKLGIITGAAGDKFLAGSKVTRQDLLLFTGKLIEKLKLPYKTVAATYLEKYKDNKQLTANARRYASIVLGNELIELKGDKIEPYRNVTKEDVSQLLNKLVQKYELMSNTN